MSDENEVADACEQLRFKDNDGVCGQLTFTLIDLNGYSSCSINKHTGVLLARDYSF